MSYQLGSGGLAGWPLGAPSLRTDVEVLPGDVVLLCIPHMRDTQTAIEARSLARRWPPVIATGDPALVTSLRAAAVQLGGDAMSTDHLAALMTSARILAARPRLAAAWGRYLAEDGR